MSIIHRWRIAILIMLQTSALTCSYQIQSKWLRFKIFTCLLTFQTRRHLWETERGIQFIWYFWCYDYLLFTILNDRSWELLRLGTHHRQLFRRWILLKQGTLRWALVKAYGLNEIDGVLHRNFLHFQSKSLHLRIFKFGTFYNIF